MNEGVERISKRQQRIATAKARPASETAALRQKERRKVGSSAEYKDRAKGKSFSIAQKRELAKSLPAWVVRRRGWTEANLRCKERRFARRHPVKE